MLVSFRWLKDYVEIDIDPQELAGKLTMAGLEVESVQDTSPGFEGVVVGRIDSVHPHPNADKLSICDVSSGKEKFRVVCGAPNVREGILSPFAKVGARIPGGFTIRSSRIRGELSEGMLCSEEELGIGEDASGILVLPEGLQPGQDLAEALELKDVVLNVSVTPNRSDCLSMVGIAREVAAITGRKVRYPEIRFSESQEDIHGATSVDILDPDLCPRYTARMIRGVKIGPSPAWMRLRLEAVGLRSINNVVDVTNFVMMELGQPLHAFDYRLLEEGRIVVRRAKEGEPFVSLDGKTRILSADALMICDGVKPVAVAGIMGGENSEVRDDTETVLLESAYFNPSSIRRNSRRLGMGTDAAFRFERGIDPEGVVRALDRAAQLIAETSGGTVLKGRIDQYPQKIPGKTPITLRPVRIREVLGLSVEDDRVRTILSGLEMMVERKEGVFLVTPPSFRVDISMETDLIEEIARINGYELIPETMPQVQVRSETGDRKEAVETKIKSVLTSLGFSEVINYSFIPQESADILGLPEKDRRRRFVRILNPLSEDQCVMRTTLVYGLLDTALRNANVGCLDLRIFEMGRIFIAAGNGDLPEERGKLAGLMSGVKFTGSWGAAGGDADFYDGKGAIENLLDVLEISGVEYRSEGGDPFLHPGRSCGLFLDGRAVGYLGEVHPDILEKLDLKKRIVVFEVDFEFLSEQSRETGAFRGYSRFPASSRDVAFLVPRDLEAKGILGLIAERREELLEKIEIFDVYMGQSIPENMKSLALRFTYRSPERTLTDEEVNRVHSAIVQGVVKKTGAKIRGE
jgi:phenylalanyl-tRNA synthetase beta chain